MGDDGRTGGRDVVAVRQLVVDGHADGLSGVDGGGWADGRVYMVDVWSDDVGQPDRCGRMVYRWSDCDLRSD